MGRDWFSIPVGFVRRPEWAVVSPRIRCAWLDLMAYCAQQENSGLLPNARRWSASAWRALGLSSSDVTGLTKAGLAAWRGNDLELTGYDRDKEEALRKKRESGKKGGDAKRDRGWGGNAAGAAAQPRRENAPSDGHRRHERGGESASSAGAGNAGSDATGPANGAPGASATDGRPAEKTREREDGLPPLGPPEGADDLAGPGLDSRSAFCRFWAALPRWMQDRRPPALRAWTNLGIEEKPDVQSNILEALKRQRPDSAWNERQRALHLTATKYLQHEHWNDSPPPTTVATPVAPRISAEEQEAKFREDWLRDPENQNREWPGYPEAVAELQARARSTLEGK